MTGSQKIRVTKYIVQPADLMQAYEKWCPYVGRIAFTVRFEISAKLVCLACGMDH